MNSLRTAGTRRSSRNRATSIASLALFFALAFSAAAFAADTTVTVDRRGSVGEYASIALDGLKLPVVSYYDSTNGALKILRCLNRSNCRGKNSVVTADTGDSGDVGRDSSLALDFAGNPVVSYHDRSNGDLKLLHCNDPACAGGDESITSPDFLGNVGAFSSLALDAAGNPVVAYFDAGNMALRILHCNDPNCTGGDESLTMPDDLGVAGTYASLALDSWGFPVVAYNADSQLRIMHCNDPNCSGEDESIATPDASAGQGFYNSLRLDAWDRPVTAYYDSTLQTLKIMHCNDVDCVGEDESIETPDSSPQVGSYPSLVLIGGLPAVAYLDDLNDTLKILRCNDADCSGGDETISSPVRRGSVGREPALAIDSLGLPIVGFQSTGRKNDLIILACDDANCM